MKQTNQIKSKCVGSVRIFDISGNFVSQFARLGAQAMRSAMRNFFVRNVFINMKDVSSIDAEGANLLIDNGHKMKKYAILDPLKRVLPQGNQAQINHLSNDFEVARFFSEDFVAHPLGEAGVNERREHVRLRSSIPIEFECDIDSKTRLGFFAVVTNLSEGGLFSEFVYSKAEENARIFLSADQFRVVRFNLYLSENDRVEGTARIAHGRAAEGGVGMEFLSVKNEGKESIRSWIAAQIMRSSSRMVGGETKIKHDEPKGGQINSLRANGQGENKK